MKIRSLKVASLLSFGPQQDFNEFKSYNLFIGKNGTGKTAALNILKGLPMQFSMLGGNKIPTQQGTTRRNVNVFSPDLMDWFNIYQNKESHSSDLKKMLEIEYEEITNTDQTSPDIKKIIFEEDQHMGFTYLEGDLSIQRNRISLVKLPETEFEFHKDLSLFLGSKAKSMLPVLNFGLYYIFGLHYRFEPNGTFFQFKKGKSASSEENKENLPSGVLTCAKLLTRYFMSKGDVILIDEPELHLEPRIVRKLFHFIIWIVTRNKTKRTSVENKIFLEIDALRKNNYSEGRSRWAIYEGQNNEIASYTDIPEINTQPNYRGKQIFISSHSSVLINEFLELRENSCIYEFNNKEIEYNYHSRKPTKENFGAYEIIPTKGLFTTVSKIENNAYSILDNLGCKGSDLLQTNGVIWVEGPSDVVYLQKWLEMYISENDKVNITQGIDYEFQMYGGTLLDSLCLIKRGLNEENELKKLVSMFSFSRNAFVITDSDAVLNANGEIIDKSKFKNAKNFIKAQFSSLNDKGIRNLGLWYKEGDTDIRTMESYLDKDSTKMIDSKSWTKKIASQEVTNSWDKNKKLDNFPNDLSNEIEILYETIAEWNK